MAAYILVDCKVTDPGATRLQETRGGGDRKAWRSVPARGGESALLRAPDRPTASSSWNFYLRSREGILRFYGIPAARGARRCGGYDDGCSGRTLAACIRLLAPLVAGDRQGHHIGCGCRGGRGRCTGGFDRTGREAHVRNGRPCRRMPFSAPVVVAHERPDAFDHVGFLGACWAQLRRVAPALPPHDRGSAFIWFGITAIVVLAVDAFFHDCIPQVRAVAGAISAKCAGRSDAWNPVTLPRVALHPVGRCERTMRTHA